MTTQSFHSPLYWPELPSELVDGHNQNSRSLDAVGEKAGMVYVAYEDMTIRNVGLRLASQNGTSPHSIEVRIETVGTDGFPSGTLWNDPTDTTKVSVTIDHAADDNVVKITSDFTADAVISRGDQFAVVSEVLTLGGGTPSVGFSRYQDVGLEQIRGTYSMEDLGSGWVQGNGAKPWIWFLKTSTGGFPYLPDTYFHFSPKSTAVTSTGSVRRLGVKFSLPVPVTVRSAIVHGDFDGDGDVVLYDSNGTTELASASLDASQRVHAVTGGRSRVVFDSDVTLSANTDYRLTFNASTTTSSSLYYLDADDATYLESTPGGTDWILTTHNGTSWTDDDTGYVTCQLGLVGFDDATGGGGASGVRNPFRGPI